MVHMKHNLVISLQKFWLKFIHILEVDSKTSMVYMSYIAYPPFNTLLYSS